MKEVILSEKEFREQCVRNNAMRLSRVARDPDLRPLAESLVDLIAVYESVKTIESSFVSLKDRTFIKHGSLSVNHLLAKLSRMELDLEGVARVSLELRSKSIDAINFIKQDQLRFPF